jgi:hypothetical protein
VSRTCPRSAGAEAGRAASSPGTDSIAVP